MVVAKRASDGEHDLTGATAGAGRILFVLGTRPEAIKLAPVIAALPRALVTICLTGQQRDLARAALHQFDLDPDIDLDVARDEWSPAGFVAAAIPRLAAAIDAKVPAIVVVQGDTVSALAGALAGHYARVPVAHVEAGLRSGAIDPFPEEMQRRLIAQLATLHFAPTAAAAAALRLEGVAAAAIHVTGNPVIDAVRSTGNGGFAEPAAARPLLLVTAHRRENHGAPMQRIADAVTALASHDLDVVVTLHPHPQAGGVLAERLCGVAGSTLRPPLDYPDFIALLRRARVVLTDSGGVQEEAPAVGVPVLVLRDSTERPEGVALGNARLVGTRPATIVAAVRELIDDDRAHARMAAAALPYGDGHAGIRIAALLQARV